MKVKNVVLVFAVFLLLMAGYRPAQAGVNVGVSVGLPVFAFPAPPEMVVIPGTYAYYVPDVDVDIFFYQGRWYRSWNGQWYWGRAYNGPWALRGPRYVPAFFLQLQPGWRQRIVVHERIPYDNFNRNWRNWERQRYWEKKHDWWKKEKDTWRDRRDDHRDGHDGRGDKDGRHDSKDVKKDRKDVKEDHKDMKGDQKGQQNKQQPEEKQKGQQKKQDGDKDEKDKN